MNIVLCIDISGKEPHRQVDMGRVVTSGNLGGMLICTLTMNERAVGSIPTLATIFIIFITPITVI